MKDLIQNVFIALSVVLLATSCYNEDNRIHPTCADGIQNQEEERIDCGGPFCDPCPPSCDNGILDYVDGWQEVGIDCGGPCLELGQDCCTNGIQDLNPEEETLSESWVDCKLDGIPDGEPGSASECPICPTCANGIWDPGEEMEIDGQGIVNMIDCDDDTSNDNPNDVLTFCPPCIDLCDDGLLNADEGPCVDCGGVCGDVCDDAACSNGVQDIYPNDPLSNETAVDCGGCLCIPCIELCGDGLLNGSEVAIDCGGDCVSCDDDALCTDGVLNGYETEIDCYDGTDGASACEPCQAICDDGTMNGTETDVDCGPAPCGPCGNEEFGYLTYYVDGVFYESFFTSLNASRVEGTITPPPGVPTDVLTFSGGINHNISFYIQDDAEAATVWGHDENPLQIYNEIAIIPNTVMLTTNEGIMYTADDPVGITIDFSTLEYIAPTVAPAPVMPGGLLEGTFSGTMFSENPGDGPSSVTITEGQFRLFFLN